MSILGKGKKSREQRKLEAIERKENKIKIKLTFGQKYCTHIIQKIQLSAKKASTVMQKRVV